MESIENSFTPKSLLIDQLKRVSTFLYILIFLFSVNILFRILSQWEGISIIVNIYLYVFSFYLIFNFSSIEIGQLKPPYRSIYGRYGDFILFVVTRIVPFSLIYLVTVVFTLINYYGMGFWPWRPLLDLLDGRFSNIVFYSLILLVVLKLKREPRITIPLFLFMSVIYFMIYKFVYTFSPTGYIVSLLKFFQITVALFFLFHEFISRKQKIAKSTVLSIIAGLAVYFSLVGIYSSFYTFSEFSSYRHFKSALILLKMGYSFPLRGLQSLVVRTNNPHLLSPLLYYSERLGHVVHLNRDRWEQLLFNGNADSADVIAEYAGSHGGQLSYEAVMRFAERESLNSSPKLANAGHLIQYASKTYNANYNDILKRFREGNPSFKIWLVRVASAAGSIQAIPFLVDLLTGIDDTLARESYEALVQITGVDKEKKQRDHWNDLALIESFYEVYMHSVSEQHSAGK